MADTVTILSDAEAGRPPTLEVRHASVGSDPKADQEVLEASTVDDSLAQSETASSSGLPAPALRMTVGTDGCAASPSGARRARTFSSTFSRNFSSDSIGAMSSDLELRECSDGEAEPAKKVRRAGQSAEPMKEVPGQSAPPASEAPGRAPWQPPQVRGSRGLHPEGEKKVEGFEACGLWVAKCAKKLPKTQSWCFVPLIFSALGRVPEWLRQEGTSTPEQIEAAQPIWAKLFSHWAVWRQELREVIDGYECCRFQTDFLPKAVGQKSWTTSLVYGEPRIFGRLPHPQGPKQDKILAMLPGDTQNQIFASVLTIASH